MGQKFSLDIEFEGSNDGTKPIVAGTPLKGNVVFHVKRKVNASDLTLELFGKESTLVSRSGKSAWREERTIARAITRLKEFHGARIPRGVYSIPFNFSLSSSLPSSVKFPRAEGRNYNGKVKYFLRVKLGDFHLDRGFMVQSAPLPSSVVPCIVKPTTHELKSFGVLNKGFLSVGASVENAHVGKGHTLRVSVASRNETSVDLSRVRVKLVELIEYRAQGQTDNLKVELDKLKDIDLPGLDKSKNNKQEVRKSIRQKRSSNLAATYRAIYNDLVSADNQFEIVVPTTARDSYDGNLMTISHYLKITFFTKAMVENAWTKIPIVIGHAKEVEESAPIRERQPHEPIATVIFDEEIADDDTTVAVGSRAEFVPMADAILLDRRGNRNGQARGEGGPNDTVFIAPDRIHLVDDQSTAESSLGYENRSLPPAIPMPSAPTESMLWAESEDENDDDTVESDAAHLSPAPRAPQGLQGLRAPPEPHNTSAYSPFQMYGGGNGPGHRRRPSYSYDTDSGMTPMSDSPQRLGAAPDSPANRDHNAQWLLESLLQELNGSIHDYEVVATKIREPGYKELFATLTPVEYRSIIGHVTMSHQVQVALLLAKQLVLQSLFTCEHCVGALQKTSDYFRSNMVETLLPYCNDLKQHQSMIRDSLTEWEQIITAQAFEAALE